MPVFHMRFMRWHRGSYKHLMPATSGFSVNVKLRCWSHVKNREVKSINLCAFIVRLPIASQIARECVENIFHVHTSIVKSNLPKYRYNVCLTRCVDERKRKYGNRILTRERNTWDIPQEIEKS